MSKGGNQSMPSARQERSISEKIESIYGLSKTEEISL